MTSAGRRDFGACRHENRTYVFDFWSPHLGIAVDVRKILDTTEVDAKAEWCKSLGIHYAAVLSADLGFRSPKRHETLDAIRNWAQERHEAREEQLSV